MRVRTVIAVILVTLALSWGIGRTAKISQPGSAVTFPLSTANGGWGTATPGAGWTNPCYTAVNAGVVTANTLKVWGTVIEHPTTFSKISFTVWTADNSANLYDFGLYNASGTLVADIGAQSLTTTGLKTIATVQGSKTIAQGTYFFALTGNASILAPQECNGAGQVPQYAFAASTGTSSGGALPASFTPPALGSPQVGDTVYATLLQ